jgi:hypothetical protein
MPRTRRRDPQREQFWRSNIQEWLKSGQRVRDFCRSRHLSEASFFAWRRELAKRDRATPADHKFLPIELRAETILEVQLPNGLIVRAPAGVEPAAVAALVAALGAAPC